MVDEVRGRLTAKQRMFVDAWFSNGFNGALAARVAGYCKASTNIGTLATTASRLFRNVHVTAYVRERWAHHGYGTDEGIARLTSQARTTMADLYRVEVDAAGNERLVLDPKLVIKHGDAIRSIRHTSTGLRLELYDSQRAIELIAKLQGVAVDKVRLETEVSVRVVGGLDVAEV